MVRRRLAVPVLLVLALTAFGITVRVLVDPWVHASRLLAQLDQLTSFHVDVSGDSVDGQLRADVELRPNAAYRILDPDGSARQLSVDGHQYDRVAGDARWLTDGNLDRRVYGLEPWDQMPAAHVIGLEQLDGGPAWHVHSDDWARYLQLGCCIATDVWIDMNGLPRRAAAIFPGPYGHGKHQPDYLVHFAYSSVNAVPAITSPLAPVPADQTVEDGFGGSGQNGPASARPLTVGTSVLVVRGFGPGFSPMPVSPPRDGYRYLAVDLEMDNRGMAPLGYQVSLHDSLGAAPVVSGSAASIPSAGELAIGHATIGRLVFQVPDQTWPRFLLAVHIGGADIYVRLFWVAPAR